MIEEMIKQFTKENNGQYEQETNLEGHNIVELTNKNDEYENKISKKCCK